MNTLLLSRHGSDRATAYNVSNKLLRRGGRIFAGWLDAPDVLGAPNPIRLGCVEEKGGLPSVHTLGEAPDNHCGPALALDRKGRLHAIIGAHAGAFLYRWSDDPENPASWSPPETVGTRETYPSLVVDAEGTLHLACRTSGDVWHLSYLRKKPGLPWEAPRVIAISPEPGYNLFMQSLSLGPGGALHLVFQFHYGPDSITVDQKGRMGVHLRSADRGESWSNEGTPCLLPLTVETAQPFCHHPEGSVRISNHVVDSQDRPWVFASVPGEKSGRLFRRDSEEWSLIPIGETLGKLNFTDGHGREVSLSRSSQGYIHLVAATPPDDAPSKWFDPRHELVHLVLSEDGRTRSFRQITDTDPHSAHWLPALENWDWNRADHCCEDGPWLLFTKGLNKGGIGGENVNTLRTEVHLMHLPA